MNLIGSLMTMVLISSALAVSSQLYSASAYLLANTESYQLANKTGLGAIDFVRAELKAPNELLRRLAVAGNHSPTDFTGPVPNLKDSKKFEDVFGLAPQRNVVVNGKAGTVSMQVRLLRLDMYGRPTEVTPPSKVEEVDLAELTATVVFDKTTGKGTEVRVGLIGR